MKPELVKSILLIVGFVFIVSGVIGGFVSYDKDIAKDYSISKDVADELWDNEFAQQDYMVAAELQKANVSSVVYVVTGGIVSGIFFIALSTIIGLLIDLNRKHEESNKQVAV